jgi:transcriptional regulator with XRE-family HTH domain
MCNEDRTSIKSKGGVVMEKSDKNLLLFMGSAVARLRVENNISQEDLSDMLDLTRPSVCNIESGKQSIKHLSLLKCCVIFDVPVSVFYPNDLTFFHSKIKASKVKERKLNKLKGELIQDTEK